jgi:para-nitrobenzyl esterase
VAAVDRREAAGEDCLRLNVFTPGLGGGRRPVMVWLHGGGYSQASGSFIIYNGANLARRRDVVVVTLNHRLDLFGYLYLGEIGGEKYADSGNAGMLDIVQSLQWVHDNIAAFGGDPGNVTIFGQSGGGGKVCTLMGMPAAKGLFHKAIAQSGSNSAGMPRANATRVAELLRLIVERFGATVVLVTHDHDLAARADAVHEMSDGTLRPARKPPAPRK